MFCGNQAILPSELYEESRLSMDESLYHRFLSVERRHWWFRARREILVRLARQCLRPGGSLLDVGCGTGYFLESLQADHATCGVDNSEAAVRMSLARGLAGITRGSAEDLSSVENRRFDLITLLDVLEHLDDDRAAVRNVRGLLSPGGHVLATVPAYQSMWSRHDDLNHHRRRYDRREVSELFQQAGLEPLLAGYFNCILFPLAWLVRKWRRLNHDVGADEFALPPSLINEALYRVFLLEGNWLARRRAMPFGLSVIVLARRLA